ncbi:HSF-type DNA-binding-domain-containing protein [Phycomyces nitens]|nr:HSF-type DNA-binding-domain-containing protein [Phycomyces nitens]
MNPSLSINSGDPPSPVNDRNGPSINNIFRIAPQVSAAFITKLYRILGIEESQCLISWTPSGTQFCVHNMHKFSKDILPQYFKHNNWPSFVRQLNMYGFHKVSEVSGPHSKPLTGHDSNVVYKFRHADFQRNRQDLLHRIRRKKPRTSHQTAFHYTNGFDLDRQQRQDSPEISSECFGLKNGDEGISVSMDQIYHIDETLERLKRKADTAQIEIDDLRKSVLLQQNLLERFLDAMNSNTESSAKGRRHDLCHKTTKGTR